MELSEALTEVPNARLKEKGMELRGTKLHSEVLKSALH